MEHYSVEKDGTFLGTFQSDRENEKDALVFHGVPQESQDKEQTREELEEKIKDLVKTEYGLECKEKMENIFRSLICDRIDIIFHFNH